MVNIISIASLGALLKDQFPNNTMVKPTMNQKPYQVKLYFQNQHLGMIFSKRHHVKPNLSQKP